MYLENIYSPADVKKLSFQELNDLSNEIRASLLQKLSEHGGHFGPNFGMVEATIALHYVFNSPEDKIVFDVSHQSYVHKMLTGRKDAFLYPAEYDNVSGYSEPHESKHDFFVIGHTSTSVSLASGLAKGRDLTGGNENRRRIFKWRRSIRRIGLCGGAWYKHDYYCQRQSNVYCRESRWSLQEPERFA